MKCERCGTPQDYSIYGVRGFNDYGKGRKEHVCSKCLTASDTATAQFINLEN